MTEFLFDFTTNEIIRAASVSDIAAWETAEAEAAEIDNGDSIVIIRDDRPCYVARRPA